MNGDEIIVHGGRDNGDQHMSDVYKLKLGGENGVCSEKIECDVALGNHMFIAARKDQIYIFGGSSDFDREYGECKNFHDTLWIGKSSAKKAKMEE